MSDFLCQEKAALLMAYGQKSSEHSAAIAYLRESANTISREQYDAASKRTEELQTEVRLAHEKLLHHIMQHRC